MPRIEMVWEQTPQSKCKCGSEVMDSRGRPIGVHGEDVMRTSCLVCDRCRRIVAVFRYATQSPRVCYNGAKETQYAVGKSKGRRVSKA